MFVRIVPEPTYAPDAARAAPPRAPSRAQPAPAPWIADAHAAWDVLCTPLYVFLDTAFTAPDLDRVAALACAGAPRAGRDSRGRAYPDLGCFCAACDARTGVPGGAAGALADALSELHRSEGRAVGDLGALAARLGSDSDAASFVAEWFGAPSDVLTDFSPTCLLLWLRLRAELLRARGLPTRRARARRAAPRSLL
jgi:hypothetical protein